jgi:RNA-directed DNA polymerase
MQGRKRCAGVSELFDAITSFGNLIEAAQRTARGKRHKRDAQAFLYRLEPHCLRLSDALRQGTWRPGPYHEVMVREPKERHISIASFADRVVHQAICHHVAPWLERSYIAHTFASIPGRGQHRALACFERFRDRYPFVLRTDIFRYFPSIDHAVLKADVQRHVPCLDTRAALGRIIDGSNPQEPVHRYFAGDDLWSPWQRRRGLPLGNLTSQMLANLYLSPLDHFVKEVLRVKGYVRYLDDLAVFGRSVHELQDWQRQISQFLDPRRLLLHPRKTSISPTASPQLFLGMLLYPGGRRRLPQSHVDRAAGRIHALRVAWQRGQVDLTEVQARLNAWVAHARHADSFGLRLRLFPKGLFCPRGEPARC